MIEDLIETGQYKEALQYLNDMDNEQVRYQRLVCLYGLKELQQAKREGMKAKVLAGETYYDVVAIYVSILKDLEEFEEVPNWKNIFLSLWRWNFCSGFAQMMRTPSIRS